MKEILNNSELVAKANKIKYFFADNDGTLTNGCTYYTEYGEFLKKYNHIDGTGFYLLKKAGIKTGIISGENSMIVKARFNKLKLDFCFLGVDNKLKFISDFCDKHCINMNEIAFIGDDINDLSIIKNVGLSFSPINAHYLVSKSSDIQCTLKGGEGAFREATEMLLVLKNKDIIELF